MFINLVGKSAFLNLFLITFFSFVKSVLICFNLLNVQLLHYVYTFSALEFQGVGNLVS